MGSSYYSDDYYKDRADHRAATGAPTFAHDAAVKAGTVKAAAHDTLNIKGKIREARDSKEHPNSTPIGIIFDETGSMAEVPVLMQQKLPNLMGLLLRKAYIEDPQILIGAIGDWPNHEKAPLQIGQFESGIEIDDNITNILLEANGGGTHHESYQNALYFFAHRTASDSFEKRGKKGYLFLIGDEMAYPSSTRSEIEELIGVHVQADVPFEEIVAAAKEKWEVFFLIPNGTQHWGDPTIEAFWKKHLGQNFMRLEDPAAVCEVIGATIGIFEGTTTADTLPKDLKDVGASDSIVATTTSATSAIAADRAIVRAGDGGNFPVDPKRSDKNERL